MLYRRIIALLILLTAGLTTKAQLYRNDFDNRYTWYPPWENIIIGTDSTLTEGNYVCLCDTVHEFGLGFNYPIPDTLNGRNLFLRFEADYRFPDTIATGDIVLTITDGNETRYWTSYHLSNYANDSAQWFHVVIDLNIPNDYLQDGHVRSFLWNKQYSRVFIDNAVLSVIPWPMPNFLPNIGKVEKGTIGLVEEYIIDGDTISEFHLFDKDWIASGIDTTQIIINLQNSSLDLQLSSHFTKDCKLLRQALVIPFEDSILTVFRRNMTVENEKFESAYYLDREGFKIGEGDQSVIVYHPNDISSIQLDANNRVAYFNIDYWRDHPMIHYPMSETMVDRFEDVSCRQIQKGMHWTHTLLMSVGEDIRDLPRIMPVPYGYESGIIFTEHADWSDIRTHHATYFGSENITKASKAIGGYVYYGIPVTKSVFYNNPDHVTNFEISNGAFPGLHATIKTDKAFAKFLKQLYHLGYEICLHTPEQYTTTPSNLAEAMRYMRRHFNTVSWIDHGYNNGSENNREDLVCDGLDLTADLWRKNGVKYLWNAYYEENRMESWQFDNNIIQPYPGFGDALPNRQINEYEGFILWSTPSTLDICDESDWDFYYSNERLQRIVDNHSVHITHVYSPWVWPGRTFWTYDADSTIVAMPSMNCALERIASLRDEHKMLPMTIKTYLDYYCGLQHVDYEIIDSNHIRLTNRGNEVKGFTLICSAPIRFQDNRFYEFRKSGEEYYIWFDLKKGDTVTIIIP